MRIIQLTQEEAKKPIYMRDSNNISLIEKNPIGMSAPSSSPWESLYRDEVEVMGIDPDTTRNGKFLRPDNWEELEGQHLPSL